VAAIADFVNVTSDEDIKDVEMNHYSTIEERARATKNVKAVRAVAQVCGANKLAVAIPCHRVVKKDGWPSGYRWDAERKRALLEREALARPAVGGRQ
jgi:AraC family transcriptional regulator of adaptative response/methylated-DNA-[protein]-cysteine methyltransferase